MNDDDTSISKTLITESAWPGTVGTGRHGQTPGYVLPWPFLSSRILDLIALNLYFHTFRDTVELEGNYEKNKCAKLESIIQIKSKERKIQDNRKNIFNQLLKWKG
jgi:hypothetical protein